MRTIALLFACIAVLCILPVDGSEAQDWNFHIVDDVGNAGEHSQIAVTSDGTPYILYENTNDNMILFVKGYKGPGKYTLKGTGNDEFAAQPNALYSDDISGAPVHIAPEKPENSFVEITRDSNGVISGHYRVTVRLDGKASNNGIKLNGEFSGVQKQE